MPELALSTRPIGRREYDLICAYLGLTPRQHLYGRLSAYLCATPVPLRRATDFWRCLAELPPSLWRLARLDLATKLFVPDHPIRHALNGVIALHECDGEAYRELAAVPSGWMLLWSLFTGGVGFALNLAITLPWLAWHRVRHASNKSRASGGDLAGERVLITGVNRGLGKDLMLHCLKSGANVIGTVRSREARDLLASELAVDARATILTVDLSAPGALVEALRDADIRAHSISMAILSAAIKHDGDSVVSIVNLRDTFQVNFFAAAELAEWLCRPGGVGIGAPAPVPGADASDHSPPSVAPGDIPQSGVDPALPAPTSLVLISSMGRWHGMQYSCGYNASKAALSIWGESLDMELRQAQPGRFTVTVVEPGLFASGMTVQTSLTRLLVASRSDVAARIVRGAAAGKAVIRPPYWFALVTWAVCLMGRNFRFRLFARAKPGTRPR